MVDPESPRNLYGFVKAREYSFEEKPRRFRCRNNHGR